jgi:hypothetical protein
MRYRLAGSVLLISLIVSLQIGWAQRRVSSRFASLGGRDARIAPQQGEWALVWGPWESGGWTDILTEPSRTAGRIGQALLGDRVDVIQIRGAWAEVREWKGAWKGWVENVHLTFGTRRVRRAVENLPSVVIVKAPYLTIDGTGSRAPFGARLPFVEGGKARLQLPDGRLLKVNPSDVAPTLEPRPLTFGLSRAKGLLRLPFQSGGNSPEGIDGAGLIFLMLRVCGRNVPRTPSLLWEEAAAVRPENKEPGDVLFFESFGEQEPVSAILVTQEALLEASPASGVNYLPLEQMSQRRLLEVRRFALPRGEEGGARATEFSVVSTVTVFKDLDFTLFVAMAASYQIVLLAFLLVLRARARGAVSGVASNVVPVESGESSTRGCLLRYPAGTFLVLRIWKRKAESRGLSPSQEWKGRRKS